MSDTIDLAAIDEADHYAVLQVRPNADQGVIRAAYKALAQAMHPDKSSAPASAGQLMARINVAYAVLSDPTTRAEYDRQLVEDSAQTQDDEIFTSDEAGDAEEWDWLDDDSEETNLAYSALFSVVELRQLLPEWRGTELRPAPLPPDVRRSAIRFNVLRVCLLVLLVPLTVLVAFVNHFAGIGLAALSFTLFVWKPYLKKERQQRVQAFRKALESYERIANEWKQKVSGGATQDIRASATRALEKYNISLSELRKSCREIAEQEYEKQLFQHLEEFSIDDAAINGLGGKRKQTLASYQIYAAAHVTEEALRSVEGFGPGLIASLLRWKDDCVDQFGVDWAQCEEIVSLHREAIALDKRIQREFRLALEHMRTLQADVDPQRELLQPSMNEVTWACAQAYADMRLVQPFWRRWIGGR